MAYANRSAAVHMSLRGEQKKQTKKLFNSLIKDNLILNKVKIAQFLRKKKYLIIIIIHCRVKEAL
jgi:hypothetical protein